MIGYIPLMQGLLTGKYRSLDEIRPILARSRHFHHSRGLGSRHGEDGAEAEMEQALKELRQISEETGIGVGDLALAWTTSNPNIATVIAGSRDIRQLEANIRGATTSMPPELRERLNRISDPILAKLGTSADYYEHRSRSRIF